MNVVKKNGVYTVILSCEPLVADVTLAGLKIAKECPVPVEIRVSLLGTRMIVQGIPKL
jgi:hypothetical protein